MGLRFRPHLHPEIVAADLVLVHGDHHIDRVEGRLFPILVPLLDGTRSADEIASALGPRPTPVDVAWGLEWLQEHGYLAAPGETPPAPSDWVTAFGAARDAAATAEGTPGPVSVHGFGADVGPFRAALIAVGVGVHNDGQRTIAVARDALGPDLGAFGERMRRDGVPWLLVRPYGRAVWTGPCFDVPRTPCWWCLARRLQERSHVVRARGVREERSGPLLPPPASLPPVDAAAALRAAATLILDWIEGVDPERFDGVVTTVSAAASESRRHRLRRYDSCPVCAQAGDTPESPPGEGEPFQLVARPKRYTADGGHRTATPEEVLARCDELISPLLGVIERVGSYAPNAGALVHAVAAEYAQPLPEGPARLPAGPVTRSAGKGMTAVQARVGALAEAIERHSGFFRGSEPRRRARLADLSPEEAVTPAELLLISAAQYADRERWNTRELPFHWLPEPFDAEREIEWSPALSLRSGTPRLLPTAYCFYAYPHDSDHVFCRADSNGCAAGSCREEAILQGLYEVIERDALALWWYARAVRPGVDITSFGVPYFDRLQETYHQRDRELTVLDITSDLGVPTFVAVSRDRARGGDDVILGAGCHLEPQLAVARALTEMNQFLPGFDAGVPRRALARPAAPDDTYLDAAPAMRARTRQDFPAKWTDDVTADVHLVVASLAEAGLDVLVVDQTRADAGLAVVKVVVPGARLFRARFAPGRLYDVPVALDWIPQPLPVGELNDNHIVI